MTVIDRVNESVQPADWEAGLARKGICRANVTECVDKGFLRYRGQRFQLAKIDRVSIALTCVLCRFGGQLAVVYPVPEFKGLPLLALEAIRNRSQLDSRPTVVCISREISSREAFMDLSNPGAVLHRQFYPVGMIRIDGSVRNLTDSGKGSPARSPVLVFSPSIQSLVKSNLAPSVAAVVADMECIRSQRISDFLSWSTAHKIPAVLFLVTNPFSPCLKELSDLGVRIWGWDKSSVRALNDQDKWRASQKTSTPFSLPYDWFLNIGESQRFVVCSVKEDRINPILADARVRYSQILESATRTKNQDALMAARILINLICAMEGLPVPISLYDAEARSFYGTLSIGRRFQSLRKARAQLESSDSGAASYLSVTLQNLENAYNLLREDPSGKPSIILAIIDEAVRQNASMTILVRNRAERRALEFFLRSRDKGFAYLMEHDIIVATPSDLLENGKVRTLLCVAVPRADQRVILRYWNARNIAIMSYPSERSTLEYLLRSDFSRIEHSFSYDSQLKTLTSIMRDKHDLRGLVPSPPVLEESALEVAYTSPQESSHQTIELEPVFDDMYSETMSVVDLEDDAEDAEFTGEAASQESDPVSGLLLRFESGKAMLVRPDKFVDKYLEHLGSVDHVSARTLEPGDLVVVINDSVRKSLTDSIIDRIQKHPSMIKVVTHQSYWIHVLRRGMEEKGDTPATLLRKLQQKGSGIQTSVAVHLWRKGVVIGPSDKQDIRRIAEIYEDQPLKDDVDKVFASVERLRFLHRSLARKLKYLIPQAGIKTEMLGDEELLIDPELNLYLEDFSDSISIETLEKIEEVDQIDPSRLNKLWRGGSEDGGV